MKARESAAPRTPRTKLGSWSLWLAPGGFGELLQEAPCSLLPVPKFPLLSSRGTLCAAGPGQHQHLPLQRLQQLAEQRAGFCSLGLR